MGDYKVGLKDPLAASTDFLTIPEFRKAVNDELAGFKSVHPLGFLSPNIVSNTL